MQDNAFKALHSWFRHFVSILRLVHLVDHQSEIDRAHVGGAIFPGECYVFCFSPMIGALESQRIAFVDFGVAAIRRPVNRQLEPIHRVRKRIVALIIPSQSLCAGGRVVCRNYNTKALKAVLGDVQRGIGFVKFVIHDVDVETADVRAALYGSISDRLSLFQPTHILQRQGIAFDGFFGHQRCAFRGFRPIDCGHEPVCRFRPFFTVVVIPGQRLAAVGVGVQRYEVEKLLDIGV